MDCSGRALLGRDSPAQAPLPEMTLPSQVAGLWVEPAALREEAPFLTTEGLVPFTPAPRGEDVRRCECHVSVLVAH